MSKKETTDKLTQKFTKNKILLQTIKENISFAIFIKSLHTHIS